MHIEIQLVWPFPEGTDTDFLLGVIAGLWMSAVAVLFSLTPSQIGWIAVAKHVLGYTLYITKSLVKEIEPNATTWFIFMYSTSITLGLEYQLGAAGYLLYLPLVCAIGSVMVALICLWLSGGRVSLPEHVEDRRAFVADVILMFLAVTAWAAHEYGDLDDRGKYIAMAGLLVASNVSTFYAFRPILRDSKENPGHENPWPWIVWTCAYVTLGIATVMGWKEEDSGDTLMLVLLLLYPGSCTYLHAKVAWYAIQR